jgi:ketosteroid isomerase-like protein
MSHIPTVQAMYAAFGAGDIATILSQLAEDIDWEYALTDVGIPWLARRRGRDQVPGFFQALQAFEFRKFQASGMVIRRRSWSPVRWWCR